MGWRSREDADELLMDNAAPVLDEAGPAPVEEGTPDDLPPVAPERTPEQMVADAEAEAEAEAALRAASAQQEATPAAVGAATLPTPVEHRPHASKVDSALRGGLQGGTGSWSDEAAAWLGSKFPNLDQEPYELIARWMEERNTPGLNRPREARPSEVIRDEIRNLNAAAREDNPKTYTGSEMVGDLALSSRLPGGRLSNAVQSFASGVGSSEAEDPLEMLAEGVATAAGGDVLQKGLGLGRRAAGAVVRSLPEGAKRVAEESAVKAAGAIKTHFKKMGNAAARKLGREMLDDKLVPFGASKRTILQNADEQMADSGQKIGEILSTVDEATNKGFDWPQARLRLLERASQLNPVQEDLVSTAIRRMDSQFERAHARGLGFADANAMKGDLGSTLNWVTDPKEKMKLQRQLYGLFNEEIEQQLGEAVAKISVPPAPGARKAAGASAEPFVNLGKRKALSPSSGDELARRSAMTGPETGAPRIDEPFDEAAAMRRQQIAREAKEQAIAQFKEQKRRYGTGIKVSELADKEGLAGEVGNRYISLSDYLTIGGGITGGSAGILSIGTKPGEDNPWAERLGMTSMASLGLGLGHKYLRQHGRAMIAKPADAISKAASWSLGKYDAASARAAPWIARNAPDLMGKFGPLLVRAYQRSGEDGVRALDMAMSDDAEYVALRDLAMKSTLESEKATEPAATVKPGRLLRGTP